jgi:hypothetical protein
LAQCRFIDCCAVLKAVERFQIDWDVADGEPGIAKAAFGDAPNQGHLPAFKPNANRTAGSGCLALSTASAGFAVTAGFTLAEAFAAVLGTRARLEIV